MEHMTWLPFGGTESVQSAKCFVTGGLHFPGAGWCRKWVVAHQLFLSLGIVVPQSLFLFLRGFCPDASFCRLVMVGLVSEDMEALSNLRGPGEHLGFVVA